MQIRDEDERNTGQILPIPSKNCDVGSVKVENIASQKKKLGNYSGLLFRKIASTLRNECNGNVLYCIDVVSLKIYHTAALLFNHNSINERLRVCSSRRDTVDI